MKIEILKMKKSFKKGGFHTNPNIGWEFILCIAFVIILASFIFGFYLFKKTNEEFIIPITDTNGGQVEMVKKERIKNVLEYFSEREKKSIEILNSPSPIVDPSL